MAKLRLEPHDEYMHPIEAAENFNESMYFNIFDQQRGWGGWFRLGNRPNEGRAEMTFCAYLPDGSVAFNFFRPKIRDNDAFDAGGMRFEVVEPFKELVVSYEGKVCVLADPTQMVDPANAFKTNPWDEAALRLTYTGVSPVTGGEPVNDDGSPITESADQGFARGHYEQHMRATGSLRVGSQEWQLNGYGLRDHSWGPRHWQTPWWYRWLTANFGEEFGFGVTVAGRPDGREGAGGVVLNAGRYEQVRQAALETDCSEDFYQTQVRLRVHTDTGEYVVHGDVLSLIPLRNRRASPEGEELMTRIAEGMTRWRCEGKVGYGMSEYLDQVIEGKPVGV